MKSTKDYPYGKKTQVFKDNHSYGTKTQKFKKKYPYG